jgi:hypothetical protein
MLVSTWAEAVDANSRNRNVEYTRTSGLVRITPRLNHAASGSRRVWITPRLDHAATAHANTAPSAVVGGDMPSHALSTTLARRFVQPCDNMVVVRSIPAGRRAAWMVAGVMAAAGLWVASGPLSLRAVIAGAAGAPVRLMRARVAEPLEAGAPLAISQVGFLPADAKPFTAREPYASVRVVDERTGQIVSQADTPLRRLPSRVTGTPAVWIGDVAPLTAPGRYHLLSDTGATSAPFTIAPDVFETPRRLVQRVFYFQRAFTAIEAAYAAGPWVHPSDAARAPAGVEGGWHDAGDYSLYNMTTVSSLFWLLQTAIDFQPADDATGVPESGNGQPDLLDEARWGLRWVLAAQTPAGAFRNSTCLADYGPYGRNPIERGPSYQAGEPGTIATARSVGVLAMAADVFRPRDAAFADRLLVAARRGWQYLEARPDEHSDGPTCGAYRQDGDVESGRAVRRFAAAGLLLATGEPRFAVEAGLDVGAAGEQQAVGAGEQGVEVDRRGSARRGAEDVGFRHTDGRQGLEVRRDLVFLDVGDDEIGHRESDFRKGYVRGGPRFPCRRRCRAWRRRDAGRAPPCRRAASRRCGRRWRRSDGRERWRRRPG